MAQETMSEYFVGTSIEDCKLQIDQWCADNPSWRIESVNYHRDREQQTYSANFYAGRNTQYEKRARL